MHLVNNETRRVICEHASLLDASHHSTLSSHRSAKPGFIRNTCMMHGRYTDPSQRSKAELRVDRISVARRSEGQGKQGTRPAACICLTDGTKEGKAFLQAPTSLGPYRCRHLSFRHHPPRSRPPSTIWSPDLYGIPTIQFWFVWSIRHETHGHLDTKKFQNPTLLARQLFTSLAKLVRCVETRYTSDECSV
jgi:hypothetical protein